jgi:hypothetical protein
LRKSKTEQALPNLLPDLNERELPNATKSSTDNEPDNLAVDLNDREEPKVTKSITEIFALKVVFPNILKAELNDAADLKLNDDPHVA